MFNKENFLTLICSLEYTGIIPPRKGGRSNVDYYGTYPLKPGLLRGYKPSLPSAPYCAPPCNGLASNLPLKLGYWELLSPALFGAAGDNNSQ